MSQDLKVYALASFVVLLSLVVPGCLTEQDHDESHPLAISHLGEGSFENVSHLDRQSLEQEVPFLVDALERALDGEYVSISDQGQVKAIGSYLMEHHDDDLPAVILFEQELYHLGFISVGKG